MKVVVEDKAVADEPRDEPRALFHQERHPMSVNPLKRANVLDRDDDGGLQTWQFTSHAAVSKPTISHGETEITSQSYCSFGRRNDILTRANCLDIRKGLINGLGRL